MRVAHLAFDQKFIPFAHHVFEEAFPGSNTWILLHERREPLRFVTKSANISLVTRRTLRSQDFLEALNSSQLLVVHAMDPAFANVIKDLSQEPTVMWFGWGYEYYSYLEADLGELILPDTSAAWQRALAAATSEAKGLSVRLKSLLRPTYRAFKATLIGHSAQETIRTVANRIDLCSVSPSEMPLLRAALPGFRAKHYQLHYFSTEDTLERGPARMTGPDILLGNSATPQNNHVEAMHLLRRMNLQGQKIIAPLSYGDSHYADEVCRIGARLFGSDFIPLRNYLSIDDYHEVLATCGTVIMNHRRQAAMGNISAALYKGARVILREENPIYQTYTGLRVTLDSVQSILHSPSAALLPLTGDERLRNREIVGSYMSRSRLVEAIRGLKTYCKPVSGPGVINALGAVDHG